MTLIDLKLQFGREQGHGLDEVNKMVSQGDVNWKRWLEEKLCEALPYMEAFELMEDALAAMHYYKESGKNKEK